MLFARFFFEIAARLIRTDSELDVCVESLKINLQLFSFFITFWAKFIYRVFTNNLFSFQYILYFKA